MMFNVLATDCDSSSRCSTASPNGDSLPYYPSPAGAYAASAASPLGHTQDFTDLSMSSASFVPTVTAISSCPDLQWMVQSVVSSVAPSNGRPHPYDPNTTNSISRARMVKSGNKSPGPSRRGRNEQLPPEEEEKRRVRRERNKMAAAKCRNRRRELTDTLQAETDQLEDEKSALQNDIANLLKEKERLEFILAAHKPICKIPSEMDITFPKSCVSPVSVGQASKNVYTTTTTTSSSASNQTGTTTVAASGPSSIQAFSSAPSLDLCASTLKISDLEPSAELLSKVELETVRSVPDIDLSGSLYGQDWEPLYTSAVPDLEPLCTPVVTCTPACTSSYTSSFVFTYPESDVFPTCAQLHRRSSSSANEQSSDSLNSPTLLTL